MGENEMRVRRWYHEVWQPGGEKTVDELLSNDINGVMEGYDVRSKQDFLDARQMLMGAFPDIAVRVEDVIEQGAKVAIRWQATATHTGGSLGFAPTGMPVSFRGTTWLEFSNGQIVRGWDSWNLGALLQSLAAAAPAAGIS